MFVVIITISNCLSVTFGSNITYRITVSIYEVNCVNYVEYSGDGDTESVRVSTSLRHKLVSFLRKYKVTESPGNGIFHLRKIRFRLTGKSS